MTLPNNRVVAERRLVYLKRKFERDAEFFAQYKEKINELLKNGFARKVPSDWKLSRAKVWIIPHACCSAGKFRVVFDCAARFAGVSLNDHLLQGPDLTNGLLGVLLRFRRGRVASSADIKAMYHQVRVDPKDWDALTFLWWPNDDYTRYLPQIIK